MPRRDGTGPEGMGPATGRGLGGCARDDAPETGQAPRLRGGRGLRNRFGGQGGRRRGGAGGGGAQGRRTRNNING